MSDQTESNEYDKASEDEISSEDAPSAGYEGVSADEFIGVYDDSWAGRESCIYNDSEDLEPAPGPWHPVEYLTLRDVLTKKENRLKKEIKGQDHEELKRRGPQVSFGSCQSRPLLPSVFPPNRMRDCYYKSKSDLGPTSYDVSSSFSYLEKVPSTNVKGWGFGVRGEPRFPREHKDNLPDPLRFQQEVPETRKFKPAYRPFGVSTDRFEQKTSAIPGPGTYDHEAIIGRRVQFEQCFGYTPLALQKKKRKRRPKSKKSKAHENRVKYLQLYY